MAQDMKGSAVSDTLPDAPASAPVKQSVRSFKYDDPRKLAEKHRLMVIIGRNMRKQNKNSSWEFEKTRI